MLFPHEDKSQPGVESATPYYSEPPLNSSSIKSHLQRLTKVPLGEQMSIILNSGWLRFEKVSKPTIPWFIKLISNCCSDKLFLAMGEAYQIRDYCG